YYQNLASRERRQSLDTFKEERQQEKTTKEEGRQRPGQHVRYAEGVVEEEAHVHHRIAHQQFGDDKGHQHYAATDQEGQHGTISPTARTRFRDAVDDRRETDHRKRQPDNIKSPLRRRNLV